jgi:transposase
MKEAVYRRCCGMDVHKETVVVSVLAPPGREVVLLRKTYRTLRNDLIRMRTWLKQLKVTEIAMESTGVYWRPLWNVLEDQGFRLLLVNPAQVKALAGRKSDGRRLLRRTQ